MSVVFTPTDTATYNTASQFVTINVQSNNQNTNSGQSNNQYSTTAQKTTPTITWNNPADIISGTLLSSTQLNAVASVPGTFVYTPLSGTTMNAGTQTLSVVFTPTDTVNYNTATKTVTINVQSNNQNTNSGQSNNQYSTTAQKTTPTITWNNPADIISGTLLSSTQLNAVASVPGTFVYTPLSGTTMNAGTQTLSVVFTPTDTVNYNTATKTVTINVQSNNQNTNSGQSNNQNTSSGQLNNQYRNHGQPNNQNTSSGQSNNQNKNHGQSNNQNQILAS